MPSTEYSGSDQTHTSKFVYVATGLAAITGLLFGHDTGVISGAILYISQTFQLSNTMKEVVTATVLIGAVVGAAAAGKLADSIGRRKLIIAMGALFVVGSGAEAIAQNLYWLLAARFVVGFGIGAASFVGPLYNAEIAPKRIRGMLVLFNQIAITSGIFVAYLLDYAFTSAPASWRWMFGVGVVPGVVLAVGMFFLPDSPRWLIAHDRPDDARQVLARVHSTTPDAKGVQDDFQSIAEKVRQQSATGYGDLLKPGLRFALWVGVGLAIFQQVTGINTIIYYVPIIFHDIGYVGPSQPAQILAGAEVAVVNVAATIAAAWLVDRTGRRVLLQVGILIMAVSLGALGVTLLVPAIKQAAGWLLIATIMTYIVGFAIGLGPVFWLLISEIYPLHVRAKAMSIATVANWSANLLVALTFLTLFQAIGQSLTFFLFAVLSVSALIFVHAMVPETRGKTLEEINDIWEDRDQEHDGHERTGQLRRAA